MQIIGVVPFAYRTFIPFKGLEPLKDALRFYSSGRVAGSLANEARLVEHMDGMSAALTLSMRAQIGDDSAFLRGLFAEIEAKFAPQGRRKKMPAVGTKLCKHYDYDGPGVFFKSMVDVAYAGGNTFLLSLGAARVGNAPEVSLAESLGIERCLMRTGVKLEIEPSGEKFVFDLDMIAAGLNAANIVQMASGSYDGGTLVSIIKMVHESARPDEQRDSPLTGGEGFQLTLAPTNVGTPWEYNALGATISGPLRDKNKYYEDKPTEWYTPAITLTFEGCRETDTNYNRLPVTDPAIAAKLTEMAAAVEASFQQ